MNKFLLTLLALFVVLSLVSKAEADLRWRCTKTYTATLAEGAKDAVVEVGETLQTLGDAKEYVDNAQAVVEGAKYTAMAAGAAAGGKAVAAADGAIALLGSASEAVAATTVVVLKGVAVAGAAAAGTAIGQGAGWLLSQCWDPVCGIAAIDTSIEDIYTPTTDAEVQALIPDLLSVVGATDASSEPLDISDFEAAGDEGGVALQFLSEGVSMFLDLARGAASATDGRYDETLSAVDDLEQQLAGFPTTISDFASVVQSIIPTSPYNTVYAIKHDGYLGADFQNDWYDADMELDSLGIDRTDFDNAISGAGDALGNALDLLEAASFLPLVTTGDTQGFFSDLTLDGFNQFVSDCAANGSACLPAEELSIVNNLLTAAGVTIPGIDVGTSIADYDATDNYCDDSVETAMFQVVAEFKYMTKATSTGALTIADILRQSVTDPLTGEITSSWMDVDLEESPITIHARQETGETEDSTASGCSCNELDGGNNIGIIILLSLFILTVCLRRRLV